MKRGVLSPGLWFGALISLALVGGCTQKESSEGVAQAAAAPPTAAPATGAAANTITEVDRKDAKTVFSERCMPCHGREGMGNGPGSKGLAPPPRNFHDKQWQAAVTDEHIEQIIQYGGAAVGKSPTMPSNPDLVDKPVIKALREKIRDFGK